MHNRHVRYLGRLADGFGDPLVEMIDNIKERKSSHREVYRPTSLHVKIDRRIERSRRRSRSPLAANHKQYAEDDRRRGTDVHRVKFTGIPQTGDSKYADLHIHSTKELRNYGKEEITDKKPSKNIIKRTKRQESDYYKQYTPDLSPLTDRVEPSTFSSRGSLDKLWTEDKIQKVYEKQAQIRQNMLRSDQKAQKYLNPNSFSKRMQDNNRLVQLVKDPELGTLCQQDAYNLQRIHSYLCFKKAMRQDNSRAASSQHNH